MSITDRTYTITLYFSEMGSTFTVIQTTENSDEAARFIAKTKRSTLTAHSPLHAEGVSSAIRGEDIVLVQCRPSLTDQAVTNAEAWLGL